MILNSSIKTIYPLMITIVNVFKFDKNSFRKVFSNINNKIVVSKDFKLKAEEILIIAPHCLQKSFCKHKVAGKIDNCKKCGACDISYLIDVSQKYNVRFDIVTGGTLARKIISDLKPKGIIAIACERDLTYGILDVKYIPVIGISNLRPEGPCYNTCVKVSDVENAIRFFLGE